MARGGINRFARGGCLGSKGGYLGGPTVPPAQGPQSLLAPRAPGGCPWHGPQERRRSSTESRVPASAQRPRQSHRPSRFRYSVSLRGRLRRPHLGRADSPSGERRIALPLSRSVPELGATRPRLPRGHAPPAVAGTAQGPLARPKGERRLDRTTEEGAVAGWPALGGSGALRPPRSSTKPELTKVAFKIRGSVPRLDTVLAREVEHLIECQARHLRGSAHGDLPSTKQVERHVNPGLTEPPLNEPSEGFRSIRLQAGCESIHFLEGFLGQSDGHRVGHRLRNMTAYTKSFARRCAYTVMRKRSDGPDRAD